MQHSNYKYYLNKIRGQVPIKESFDIVERKFFIGGREAHMFFVDGLTDGQKCQLLLNFMLDISPHTMSKVEKSEDFLAYTFPFLDSSATDDVNLAIKQLYSGLVPVLVDGLEKIIIADAREYPQRTVEEPDKEKTLRGAKDGFTENFMSNLGLIRRRIRDNRLILKNYAIGIESKTDVALCFMRGLADPHLVEKLDTALSKLLTNSVSMADQSIVELLLHELGHGKKMDRLNPFPKVRYTQRPDIICAHLTEGRLAIVVDNSPTVILLPIGLFDFTQDVDDYYFPLLTGNYFRFLRIVNQWVILLLSPLYLLIVENDLAPPFDMNFMIPDKGFAIPVFFQFLLLEFAIDGLKLASLNTPDSLGTSLSVIGALILGQFSIDAGWFIPQTILIMAVVALASFTQPSIELSYGVKIIRVFILIAAYVWGIWGFAAAFILGILFMATTKTISGYSYLFPLIPLEWDSLKKLLFRWPKS